MVCYNPQRRDTRIAILFDGPLALRAHNRLSISDDKLQIAQARPTMLKHLSSLIPCSRLYQLTAA